jgi:hypothetical protein
MLIKWKSCPFNTETQDEDVCIAALCVIIIAAGALQRQYQRKRRIWTRPWIERRDRLGAYHALMQELRDEDPSSLRNFIRMDITAFHELHQLVSPFIRKRDTIMRNSISTEERLALTLRFLATGEKKCSISIEYYTCIFSYFIAYF